MYRRLREQQNKMFAQGYHWCVYHKRFEPIERFYKVEMSYYGYENFCEEAAEEMSKSDF